MFRYTKEAIFDTLGQGAYDAFEHDSRATLLHAPPPPGHHSTTGAADIGSMCATRWRVWILTAISTAYRTISPREHDDAQAHGTPAPACRHILGGELAALPTYVMKALWRALWPMQRGDGKKVPVRLPAGWRCANDVDASTAVHRIFAPSSRKRKRNRSAMLLIFHQ